MGEPHLIVGLDQGTTSTRACLMDNAGKIVQSCQRKHQQFYPQQGWVEHDPLELWIHTQECLAEIAKGVDKGSVAGIGIANQGETVLVWDRVTGKPLYNALVWQDLRSEPFITELKSKVDENKIRSITGLRLDAYFSAGKIRWLLDNLPETQVLLRQRRLCIGTVDSWLIWKLTVGRHFVTDASTASRTLLFNPQTSRYDPWLLKLFDISETALPEVLPCDGFFGNIEGLTPNLEGVPIRASLVDQPASLFAQRLFCEGDLKATYGTGCFVYANTGNTFHQTKNGLLSTLVWQRSNTTTYGLDGGVFAAGSAIEWLIRLGILSSNRELDVLADSVPDTAGLLCVPALAGLASPFWQREIKGLFLGLGLHTTRAHLVRAVLEGIAMRVAQVVCAMKEHLQTQPQGIKVDGGLSASRVLMQMQSDLLGMPLEVAQDGEATQKGVCYVAALATNLWKDLSEIPSSQPSAVYRPRTSKQQREVARDRFQRAIQLLQGWHTP